jgi:Tfp pilus assembly pilus retraction ATPase PilT
MDITEVLAFSVQQGASDLHLSAGLPPMIRVDADVRRMKKKSGGRIAAHEIMRGTSATRNLIREDKVAQIYSAIQTGQAIGMQTMDQCL